MHSGRGGGAAAQLNLLFGRTDGNDSVWRIMAKK